MRNLLIVLLGLSIGLFACSTTDTDQTPDPNDNTPVIPTSFTKKVMIEKFTGEWCGACPSGQNAIKSAADANPGRVVSMALHKANPHDRYENAHSLSMISHLTNTLRHPGLSSIGYPTIIIGRKKGSNNKVINGFSSGTTVGEVSNQLSEEAICGLKLETKLNAGKLDVKVGYSFAKEASGSVTLVVALLENNLDGSAQVSGGSNYMHQHVLRELITSTAGVPIDGSTTGAIEEIEYSDIDLGAYNVSECEVIAYIVENNGTWDTYKILNAQSVHAGDTQDFD